MPAGRPSSYKPEFIQAAKDYLGGGFAQDGDVIPTIEGFAFKINASKSMVYRWKEDHPEFRDALDDLLHKQAQKLLNCGLTGDFNSTISKLILHNHGYSDTSKSEVSGPNGLPIEHDVRWSVEFLNPSDAAS